MDRRIRENFLYVAGELASRFGRPVVYFCLILAAGGGIVRGFQKMDAYLTPSYAKEETIQGGSSPKIILGSSIAIPRIQVEAPITFVQSTNPDDFLEPLKKGVAHYPSALPGQKGVSIMLGHSAPPGWFGNFYDGVFTNLKDLEQGDQITVTTNGKSHAYRVAAKTILSRGQDIPEELMRSDQSRIVLLSCWPPGINNKRIMVQADEI